MLSSLPALSPAASVLRSGLAVLSTPVLAEKIRISQEAVQSWNRRELDIGTEMAVAMENKADIDQDGRDRGTPLTPPPDFPARPVRPRLVEAREIQSPKQTAKSHGLTLAQVLLHNVAHIELTAVDMYWDTIVRFAPLDPALRGSAEIRREFCRDFIQVVGDEARHLDLTLRRMHDLGIEYGALDCHKSLWDVGIMTRFSSPRLL